ncbi:MAG: DNA polymerase III subunit chi [Candidatus Accumulibacter sp.]|nr:DNA polymerase III subunit chi [Accumulibacter sp.]
MTRVFFYFNAPDRIAASAALVAGAYRQKKQMFIYAPDAAIANAIHQQLWAVPATGFVPHVDASSPLADQTPVLIAASTESRRQTDRMLNLSDTPPPGFAEFDSLVEVVGRSDEEKSAGRERARFYKDRGYAVEYFDLQEKR